MELTFFSLLYPNEQSQKDHFSGKYCPDIDMYTLDELGLLEAFDLKNSKVEEYFTIDPAVMRYRNEMFADMLRCPALGETLGALMPVLSDIMELRRLESDSGDTHDYLSSMTEIELYISCIELLQEGLNSKLNTTPEDVRAKFRGTLTRIVNEGATGLICIIL